MHSCENISLAPEPASISLPPHPASTAHAGHNAVPARNVVLGAWATYLGVADTNLSAGVSAADAYLYSAREDHAAELEHNLDELRDTTVSDVDATPRAASAKFSAPATLSDANAVRQRVIIEALAAISTDSLSIDGLRAEVSRTEHAMALLRAAAPLNGQALRSDFLYDSGLDDAVFAGAVENFAGDTPSYNAAMRSDDYKQWEDGIDVKAGLIDVKYVTTLENHADVLTKALHTVDFNHHVDAILTTP